MESEFESGLLNLWRQQVIVLVNECNDLDMLRGVFRELALAAAE